MNDHESISTNQNPTGAEACDTDPTLAATATPAGVSEEAPAADGSGRVSEGHEDPALSASSLPDPDPCDPAPDESDPIDRLEQLRAELTKVREELAEQKAFWERVGNECAEFCELFPTVSLAALPDGVWKDVGRGIPLAAAYALSERRRAVTEAAAKKSNAENRQRSSGALCATEEGYFSPAEVRAMSRDEVRKNYQNIMYSMQKWH